MNRKTNELSESFTEYNIYYIHIKLLATSFQCTLIYKSKCVLLQVQFCNNTHIQIYLSIASLIGSLVYVNDRTFEYYWLFE